MATAAQHRVTKLLPRCIGQRRQSRHRRAALGNEATSALHRERNPPHCQAPKLNEPRSHSRTVSDPPHSIYAPFTFTFIFRVYSPPISSSFYFSFQLLDLPVGSDSLNISPHARWVECLLGCTRGHSSLDVIQGVVE